MTQIRMALMLYFFIVAHKAACQTLSKAFLKSIKVEALLVLECSSQRVLKLKICYVVLLPAKKPACSLAMQFFPKMFIRLHISSIASLHMWPTNVRT